MAIFIFAICFGLTIMSVKLASGKSSNAREQVVSNGLRNAIETINSKMQNPNNKVTIGTTTIYGFQVIGNILAIALRPRDTDECIFIGKKDDNSLAMLQNNCQGQIPAVNDLNQPLTPPDVKVTEFSFPNRYEMTDPAGATKAPFLEIKILVEDSSDSAIQFGWQTSYALDYLTLKSFLSPNFEATK